MPSRPALQSPFALPGAPSRRGGRAAALEGALLLALLAGCATTGGSAPATDAAAAAPEAETAAADPTCDDAALTRFDGLLILAPHPDDEMLGFAGLADAYRAQGKPVRAVVVTDGDAYCEACMLWKNASLEGETCNAEDLSRHATPEIDSFAEIRRRESAEAAAILGLPAPLFLGYPDTGLAAAWAHHEAGRPDAELHRSDFSGCESCGDCPGYGAGPSSGLTAATLVRSLGELLAESSPGTLVATTHWLDGHGDHAALGRFVRELVAGTDPARPAAFAVIHAHTPKDAAHPDCWYPTPAAPVCPCHDEARALAEPGWLAAQRALRYRPESAASLPDDADYGPETLLCLAPELWSGEDPMKHRIVRSYASQLGFLARDGELPEALGGLVDCNGYLLSFVRRTEAFVLIEPEPAG